MNQQYHSDVLPQITMKMIEILQKQKPLFLSSFYLTGGTALSLLIGHRESEDLDFFTAQKFNPLNLQIQLEEFGRLEDLTIDSGTLNVYLKGVKLQFLEYPYSLLESLKDWNGMFISSIEDIACTKLHTISARGSKKDFIDLYFLLKRFSLEELFVLLSGKYKGVNFNETHILKSLTYFNDADMQPMPRMHKLISWDKVKFEITKQVKKFQF